MAITTWRCHFSNDVEFVEVLVIYEGLKDGQINGALFVNY